MMPHRRKRSANWIVSGLYLLLSFPLFYFVYKYGNPEPLAHDFFQYYRLYLDLDIGNVNAPFNMRLVGAFVVHLFYELNFFYDTETAFDVYKSLGFLKQVYFNAALFNWLCVVVTCMVIFYVLRRHGISALLAFVGGLLYLLGFGTIFYQLMPLTDACSTLLFALALAAYLRRSYWVMVPVLLLILQREFLLLAIGLLALCDLSRTKKTFYFWVLIAAIASFTAYYILRKTVFYTTALDFQSDPGFMLKNLTESSLAWGSYLKQFLLTINIFLIYLLVLGYKRWSGLAVDRFELLKIIALLLLVHFVSITGGHGNNAGRYFYLVVPLIMIQLVKEMRALLPERHFEQREHL